MWEKDSWMTISIPLSTCSINLPYAYLGGDSIHREETIVPFKPRSHLRSKLLNSFNRISAHLKKSPSNYVSLTPKSIVELVLHSIFAASSSSSTTANLLLALDEDPCYPTLRHLPGQIQRSMSDLQRKKRNAQNPTPWYWYHFLSF